MGMMRRHTISYEKTLQLLREGKQVRFIGVPIYQYRIDGATIRLDTWHKLRKFVELAGREEGDYIYKLASTK